MKIYTEIVGIKKNKKLEFANLNSKIEESIEKSKIKEGKVIVFSRHTTFSIIINEFESYLLNDIYLFLNELAPKNANYFHDNFNIRKNIELNERKNAEAHLKALLLSPSQIIPIKAGKMLLGIWQSIFGIELDGPRERKIVVQIIGN